MRLFIIYTEYCLNKIRHEIKPEDFLYVNKTLRCEGISCNIYEFCISSFHGRLKFYFALKKNLQTCRITKVYFHNFTDYTFYMIYSMFRKEKVFFSYISDGIGTFLYADLALLKVLAFRVLFLLQFRQILVLPPFNFLVCYNVNTYGFEDINLLRSIKKFPDYKFSDKNKILLIGQPNTNIIHDFSSLFGVRTYSNVYFKPHPLNLVASKANVIENEIKIVTNVDANAYDLIISFNSSILIELVQNNPDLKFVVIFQKDKEFAARNIDRIYNHGFFDSWDRIIHCENVLYSNFNFNKCLI